MTDAQILAFYQRLSAAMPAPETELAYVNVYTLLVAVVLSAQATDVGVNKATRRLFEIVQTPAEMVALGEAGLKEHIKTIGLFNTKAKNVIALSQILVRDFGGEVPQSREVLETLPGVEHKVANAGTHVLEERPGEADRHQLAEPAGRHGHERQIGFWAGCRRDQPP